MVEGEIETGRPVDKYRYIVETFVITQALHDLELRWIETPLLNGPDQGVSLRAK